MKKGVSRYIYKNYGLNLSRFQWLGGEISPLVRALFSDRLQVSMNAD
ncbi:hypothetical protein [Zhongshania arctica]|uniref:Uncharacterized protein n=1 Tax=Zhongshania arctica TaxID=3238302 RepID=A0ABV3TWJ2_9GAMM